MTVNIFGHAPVNLIPEQPDLFQRGIRVLADKILKGSDKGEAALHNHTVLYDGGEQIVHIDNSFQDSR